MPRSRGLSAPVRTSHQRAGEGKSFAVGPGVCWGGGAPSAPLISHISGTELSDLFQHSQEVPVFLRITHIVIVTFLNKDVTAPLRL